MRRPYNFCTTDDRAARAERICTRSRFFGAIALTFVTCLAVTQYVSAASASSEPSESLAENAWDFNRPETIPGFGPMTPTAPRHAQQVRNQETAAAPEKPVVDIRALLDDPAIRAQSNLAENAWDFNNPDSIPGFGSMPSADEPRRLARAPQAAE